MKRLTSLLAFSICIMTGLWSQVTPPPPPPPPPPMEEEETFKVVEEMPRFPGCEGQFKDQNSLRECAKEKMLEYIYSSIQYPAEARERGIEGMAVVQFVVDKDGSIVNGKILRDPGGGCGEEALRIVNKMNGLPLKWISGKQRGRAVRVLYTLPIKFSMTKTSDVPAPPTKNGTNKGMVKEVPPPPPPPPPPAAPKRKKKKKQQMEVEEEPVFEDVEVDDTPVFEDLDAESNKEVLEEQIFKVVQEMPRFPGCEGMFSSRRETLNCANEKMLEYIYGNLIYPEEARKKGVEGMCVIQFVIGKDGIIRDAHIERDIGASCGEAALKTIYSMNDLPERWIPGKHKGKPVSVFFTLPVRFKLEGK